MDGVVVDTSAYHYAAWRRLANQLGFDYTEDQHLTLRGIGRMESLERILEWGGMYMTEAEKLHWADVKNNWYLDTIVHMKPEHVLPGVPEFLQHIRAEGIKTALSSASRNARLVLRSSGLEPFFDVIVDGNDIRKPKPDPDSFLSAAIVLGLHPSECVVFEDMPAGIEAALRGGFIAIGVGEPADLLRAHAVIPGFTDLNFHELLAQVQEAPAANV